jgi:hypothetical protein
MEFLPKPQKIVWALTLRRLRNANLPTSPATVHNPSPDGGTAPPLQQAQQGAQAVNRSFKDACRKPALALLVDRVPGRLVVGNQAPGGTATDQKAQAVEDFAQRVFALRGILGHQGRIRSDDCPFFIADITGIRFSAHLPRSPYSKVHNRL